MTASGPSPERPGNRALTDGVLLVAALAVLAIAGWATGGFWYEGGGIHLAPEHRRLLIAWTLGALPLWFVLTRMLEGRAFTPPRPGVLAALAAAAALAVQTLVLRGAPIADDESVYLFAARTLAHGRLWVASPDPRLAFDHTFFVNDGRWFTQYSFGWPALLVLPERLGVEGLVAPVLFGLTVWLAAGVARSFSTEGWVAPLLIASSPGLICVSGTLLSYTACILALTATTAAALRARAAPHVTGGLWVTLAFSVAVWIRPSSAVGLGSVWLGHWAWHWWKRGHPLPELALAALPAVGLGVPFVAVNQVMNGSPGALGYASMLRYVVDNQHRFSTIDPTRIDHVLFDFSPASLLTVHTAALLRIDNDLWGWPISLALVQFARWSEPLVRWLAASIGVWFLVHFGVADVGIEDVAPTHFLELFVPLAWLTASGVARIAEENRPRVVALVLAGVLVGTGFTAVRVRHLAAVAVETRRPLDAVAHLEHGLVFAPFPFWCQRPGAPATSVFATPTNAPDLSGRVVWVNDLGREQNLAVAARFADREAVVLSFDAGCDPVVTPLR